MKKKQLAWTGSILLLLTILILVSGLCSCKMLSVSKYRVQSPKLASPVRIVQLTDLHNREFGENNARLIRRVLELSPDLILLTGDLINQSEKQTGVAEELIQNLSTIAPVYMSFGNHEETYERVFDRDLKNLFTDAGAYVLDYDWTEVVVQGQSIRMGGVYGYCLPKEEGEARKKDSDYLKEFQNTEDYTVLLCHMPVCWIRYGSLDSWNVDCVLSGHDHGGQIRIPFVGGLWAPDQGWFPGRDCGLYWSKDAQRVLVLSRGLGSSARIPRINNIPEILVLDLLPEE